MIGEHPELFQIIGLMFHDQPLRPRYSSLYFRQLRVPSHYDYRRKIVVVSNLFAKLQTISIRQLIRDKYERESLKTVKLSRVIDRSRPRQLIAREDTRDRIARFSFVLDTEDLLSRPF